MAIFNSYVSLPEGMQSTNDHVTPSKLPNPCRTSDRAEAMGQGPMQLGKKSDVHRWS